MDEKKEDIVLQKGEDEDKSDFRATADKEQEIFDMKQDMEDYLEEQGIYIRQ